MYSRNGKLRYKGQSTSLLPGSSFPAFQKARLCKDRKRKISKEQNVDLSREDEIIYTQRGLKMFFFVKWQTYRFIVNMWVRFLSHFTSKPAA